MSTARGRCSESTTAIASAPVVRMVRATSRMLSWALQLRSFFRAASSCRKMFWGSRRSSVD